MQMRKVGAKEDIHYIFVKTGLAQVSPGSRPGLARVWGSSKY